MLRSSIKSSIVSSLVTNLLGKEKSGFTRPSDWPEIRYNAPANSIVLLVGTTSSYGSAGTYDNFKFTATATGGYNVYIDNTLYGTYASAANCAIVWSTYNATTGQAVTTPSALTAHVLKVVPVSATITAFHCVRTAASGIEDQGVLWAHFNLSNQIDLSYGFGYYNYYANRLIKAVTAKNNVLNVSDIMSCFVYGYLLSYIPIIDGNGNTISLYMLCMFAYLLKNITLRNITISSMVYVCYSNYVLVSLSLINCAFSSSFSGRGMLSCCYKLPKFPNIDFSKITTLVDGLAYCHAMEEVLDLSSNTVFSSTGVIECQYSDKLSGVILNPSWSNMGNINLTSCNLAHAALVTLFNSMPTVTSSTCTITRCPGVSELTADEKAIATGKGWTLVL